ncbi:MAG: bifunctional diguanylate cyclase/phosphodiesterase [Pseudomonadota bacterium]
MDYLIDRLNLLSLLKKQSLSAVWWWWGLALGVALATADVLVDAAGVFYSDGNIQSYLRLLGDEIVDPKSHEIWLRILMVGLSMAFMVAIGRERTAAGARMAFLALHDPLTELPNRVQFLQRLIQEVAYANRHHAHLAILQMGLDHFKAINDRVGHSGGDRLLVDVARRIRATIRAEDYVARLGSDHFAIVVRSAKNTQQVTTIARNLLTAMVEPLIVDGKDLLATASIGIAMFPDDANDAEKLMYRADIAMYQAKKTGRNNMHFYSAVLDKNISRRVQIEADLRHAIERDELVLYYQPIVNPMTRRVRLFEALVRWKHSSGTMIQPAEFIPIAEESGLILPIGQWILRQACSDMRRWYEAGTRDLAVAVNVSSQQLRRPGLVAQVKEILAESSLPSSCLELEITEGTLVDNLDVSTVTMLELRNHGVRFAIDDFGTGYSCMNYLARLPVDKMKIDRSFLSDIEPGSSNETIIKAIIALAHQLRITVVAEGVETEDQLTFLLENGCDAMQGFYFSRPVPFEATLKMLNEVLPLKHTSAHI